MPKFSIVTVCYNAESIIKETIDSVLSQTYSDFEYIIIDGASKDATLSIVKSYLDDRIKVISEPDKGIYDAMNKAIRIAHGDYINFMNAGDSFYDSNVLFRLNNNIEQGVGVFFGDVVLNLDGIKYIQKADPFYLKASLCQNMGFCHQSAFVKTELAKKYPFDYRFKLAADYNMIITLYRNNATFQYIELPVANYDLTGVSSSRKMQHITETFVVDYGELNVKHIIKIYVRYFIFRVRKFLKGLLDLVCPSLMSKKRTNDSGLIKID